MKTNHLILPIAIFCVASIWGLGLAFLAPVFIALLIVPLFAAVIIGLFIHVVGGFTSYSNVKAKRSSKQARVLVVEDDFDTAQLVSTALRNIGCEVETVENVYDAAKQLTLKEYDTVILDWFLNENHIGQEVLDDFHQTVEATDVLKSQFENKAFNLITFSSAKRSEIRLKENSHFVYDGHWQKPMGYGEIQSRSLKLIAS